jgi:hypothetical protein
MSKLIHYVRINTIDDTNDNMNLSYSLDDIEFQLKSPIIINFHSGGMVLGSRCVRVFILDFMRLAYTQFNSSSEEARFIAHRRSLCAIPMLV